MNIEYAIAIASLAATLSWVWYAERERDELLEQNRRLWQRIEDLEADATEDVGLVGVDLTPSEN